MAYEFLASGAADEVTLRWNREAFQRIALRPRVLRDTSRLDTTTTLLGETLEFRVLLTPVAYQRLMHPDGEVAAARGAAASGAIYIMSTSRNVLDRRGRHERRASVAADLPARR
jgi:4-hydroxymandelate oxidase